MNWHVIQSGHNYDSNRYLAKANQLYIDWEITTLFYSAVHMVDSYLILIKKKPQTHTQRRKLIRSVLHPIFDQYNFLECLSRKARYDLPSQNLTPDEKRDAAQWHAEINSFVKKQSEDLIRSGKRS